MKSFKSTMKTFDERVSTELVVKTLPSEEELKEMWQRLAQCAEICEVRVKTGLDDAARLAEMVTLEAVITGIAAQANHPSLKWTELVVRVLGDHIYLRKVMD